jgi:hypothetical protein
LALVEGLSCRTLKLGTNEGFQDPTATIQVMNRIGELKEHIQLGVEAPNKVLKSDKLQGHFETI